MNLPGLIAFAAIVLFFVALFFWTNRRGPSRSGPPLDVLAANRGWRIAVKQEGLGKGRTISVSSLKPEGWSLVATRYSNPESGTMVLTTEFRTLTAVAVPGSLAIGPPIPLADKALAASFFAPGGIGGRMLPALIGADEGGAFQGLELCPQPAGGFSAGTVLASGPEPSPAALAAYEQALADWQRHHPQDDRFPILLRHGNTLRLRLRTDLSGSDEIEAFIDLALGLAARIDAPA